MYSKLAVFGVAFALAAIIVVSAQPFDEDDVVKVPENKTRPPDVGTPPGTTTPPDTATPPETTTPPGDENGKPDEAEKPPADNGEPTWLTVPPTVTKKYPTEKGSRKPSFECHFLCRYTFCGDGGKFLKIGLLNNFTPAICDKKKEFIIGAIDNTREPYVLWNSLWLVKISAYKPAGLLRRYSRSFFKSYYLGSVPRSGVVHETPEKNQRDFLNEKCILLPLRDYQVLDKNEELVKIMKPSFGEMFQHCVAFETRV